MRLLVHLYSPHDSGLADDSACCCRSVVLVASVRGAFPAARFGVPFFRGGKNRLRVCFGDVFNLSGLMSFDLNNFSHVRLWLA